VTLGGTREPIDAVRYIGNHSSGKQGIAFAKAAKSLGAEVSVIAANVDSEALLGIEVTKVQTALQLHEELMSKVDKIDVLIMAAAVADFSPDNPSSTKLKRSELGSNLSLNLSANPDILKEFVKAVRAASRRVLTLGFAAEAGGDLEDIARAKLVAKGCDYILANDVSNGAVFGSDDNSVLLISRSTKSLYQGTKVSIANAVMSKLATKVGEL
jgi:phosphopantothenoylcysteine decarboxylase/phosphopantothenate--cysteine ligase